MRSSLTFALCTFLLLILYPALVHGQWSQTSTSQFYISTLSASGLNLFAGTVGAGILLSTDNGTSWTAVNAGLGNSQVRSLAVSGTNLFAGTDGGVFLSTNNGASWAGASTGLTGGSVYALAVSGTNLFASTVTQVSVSTDIARSWTTASGGLASSTIYSLAVSGTNLFAGTYDAGVFLSTNYGVSWTQVNSNLPRTVYALAVSGTNLFAGTRSGVFLSTNNGGNWTSISPDLSGVYSLAIHGDTLFAGRSGYSVYVSTDNGHIWSAANDGLITPHLVFNCFAFIGNIVFVATDAGVWKRSLSQQLSSVEHLSSGLPDDSYLKQNYPNPFNPTTNISFKLPSSAYVSLTLHDLLGRLKATLVRNELSAGSYTVHFDGSGLSSGVYFYRLQAGSFIETKKLILQK